MAYWLYVTNFDNWNVTKETNILGVSEKFGKILSRVKKGDKCLIYLKTETVSRERYPPQVAGAYQIVSEVFKDSKVMFHAPYATSNETYGLRVRLEPLRLFELPIEFKPLVLRLAFITNKAKWFLNLRGRAMVAIPKSDYDLILSAAHH
jgi:predicted RNA-binding protein